MVKPGGIYGHKREGLKISPFYAILTGSQKYPLYKGKAGKIHG